MYKAIMITILFSFVVCVACNETRQIYLGNTDFNYTPAYNANRIERSSTILIGLPEDVRSGGVRSGGVALFHVSEHSKDLSTIRAEEDKINRIEDSIGFSLMKLVKSHGFNFIYDPEGSKKTYSKINKYIETKVSKFNIFMTCYSHGFGFFTKPKVHQEGAGEVEVEIIIRDHPDGIYLWSKKIFVNPIYKSSVFYPSQDEAEIIHQEVLNNLFAQVMQKIDEEIPWNILDN